MIRFFKNLNKFKKYFNFPLIILKQPRYFFFDIGTFLYLHSFFRLAIFFLNISFSIFKRRNDLEDIALCNLNLGNIYSMLGKFNKGINYIKRAKEIFRKNKDKINEAGCNNNLGNLYFFKRDYKKAISYYEEFFNIYENSINKFPFINLSYQNILNACLFTSDFRRVKKYSIKLYNYFSKHGNDFELMNLSLVSVDAFMLLGNYSESIKFSEKGLTIAKALNKKEYISMFLFNLGNIFSFIGNYDKAKDYFDNSFKITEQINNKNISNANLLLLYNNLSLIFKNLGNYDKAIKLTRKTIYLSKKFKNIYGLSTSLTNYGIIQRHLGNYEEAIRYHKESLELKKNIKDRVGEARCYGNLGITYLDIKDSKNALHYTIKSIRLSREIGIIDNERIVTETLVIILKDLLKKYYLAYKFCKHTIYICEVLRKDLYVEEHKFGLASKVTHLYGLMIQICIEIHKKTEAYNYLEKMKSMTLLELLSKSKILPKVNVDEKFRNLLEIEKKYINEIKRVIFLDFNKSKDLLKIERLKDIDNKLQKIYKIMKKVDPEYTTLRNGESASYEKIWNLISSNKKNVKIVQYFFINKEIYIFIISSNKKELECKKVNISIKELYKHSYNYWMGISKGSNYLPNISWQISEETISKILINPLEKYLNPGDIIYFVPYNFLHYLPLHALRLNNKPLIDSHIVVYIPSSSILQFLNFNKKANSKSSVSLGVAYSKNNKNKRLKEIELETKEIAGLLDCSFYLNEDVSKDKLHLYCKNKEIIHIACHGIFDRRDPLQSGIALYDGLFSVKEIMEYRNIFVNSELVVLSACETGFNKILAGDELIGLARSLFYSGVKSLILSLWPVDSISTKELMIEFYKILKSGESKGNALRRAQLKLRDKYSHPFFWAPFILIGKWK
jgi:CHAT domain-containing protein/Tfp pilus assembly protein PilF